MDEQKCEEKGGGHEETEMRRRPSDSYKTKKRHKFN